MLSFDYKSNYASLGKPYLLKKTGGNTPTSNEVPIEVSEDSWKHFSQVLRWPSTQGYVTYALLIPYYAGKDRYLEIKDGTAKLEKGNKTTDWTPAPEDTEASIDSLSSYTNSIRNWYATCSTAAATAAKIATIDPTTTDFTTSILTPGTVVFVKFTTTNTGAVGDLTLNVNNTGAKPIRQIRNGTVQTIPGAGYIAANATYQFTYDGTN